MFSPSAYCTLLDALPDPSADLAAHVFGQVFRRDFSAPGAAVLRLERPTDSHALRRFMAALKESLSDLHRGLTGRPLAYLSLARFNQQVTTKYHLDGAPAESYLMLGYEPTEVASELFIADYTRAAHEADITPQTLLEDYNPMFAQHERKLIPYITRLDCFRPRRANILLINNSSLPYVVGGANSLGVMHKATVADPRPDRSRTVNSTMVAPVDPDSAGPVAPAELLRFLETDDVAGKIAG